MWTAEARARSQAKVKLQCMVCGKVYRVCRSQAPRSRRCPECQQRYYIENKKEKRQLKNKGERNFEREPLTVYHLVADPDGSWGQQTVLAKGEVKELLKLGYLAVGTALVCDGVRFEVVRGQGGLELARDGQD